MGGFGPLGSTGEAPAAAADVGRAAFADLPVQEPAPEPALEAEMADGTRSEIIEDLLNRRSVLQPGPLRDVADAVMAANSRAAEADLRAARLREVARQSNWLPQIGPRISLDALGEVVTSLVLSQTIFDNGGRRAERDYARADVEVAAVTLAQDSNQRVYEALDLYLIAEAAQARAEVSRAGLGDMEHFAWIMTERVNAGISDRADLQVVQQKLDQMRADLASDLEAAATARAELAVLSALPLDGVRGLSGIDDPAPTAVALTVLEAQAEGARSTAQAEATRAGFLPGLSVGGDVSEGTDGLRATIAAPNGLSLGTGAALQAAEAEAQAVAARLSQEQEEAAREIAALEGRLATAIRESGVADGIAAEAAANYALFAEQQKHGQRGVPETVSVFETRIRAERVAAEADFAAARIQLRIAARLGVLVEGDQI